MSDPKGPQTKRERIGGDELHEINKETAVRAEPPIPMLSGVYRLGHASTFWEDLDAIAKDCDAILLKAGLPEIEKSGGFGGPYRKAEPLSEAWFAAKIGLMCRDIRQGKETPTEWTLERALSLGQLLETRDWRRAFKEDTVRGIKVLGGANNSNRSGKYADDTEEILSEMNRLIHIEKKLTRNAAAHHLAPKFGKDPSAIRSLWYRHLKKGSET